MTWNVVTRVMLSQRENLPVAGAWEPLRGKGFAVRRGDTFPGLDPHHIRLAVRDTATTDAFVTALQEVLA